MVSSGCGVGGVVVHVKEMDFLCEMVGMCLVFKFDNEVGMAIVS